MSPSEDNSNSDAFYTLPEQSLGILTPLLDETQLLEPRHNQSHSPMWQFGEAIDIRDENSDTSKQRDARNRSFSDQPHDAFSEFMLPFSEDKVRTSSLLCPAAQLWR